MRLHPAGRHSFGCRKWRRWTGQIAQLDLTGALQRALHQIGGVDDASDSPLHIDVTSDGDRVALDDNLFGDTLPAIVDTTALGVPSGFFEKVKVPV